MRNWTWIATLILSSTVLATSASPTPIGSLHGSNARYVNDIKHCPALTRKAEATNIHDVRPDDFSVVMALGDSITAGLFATPSELSKENLVVDAIEKPVRRFRGQPQRYLGTGASSFIPGFEEYRGISYAMGDDEGAETIPNMIRYYRNESVKGTSHEHHPPPIIPSPPQIPIGDHVAANDGLNAALSGSKAKDLTSQVKNYLLPSLESLDIQDHEWKLLTLSIGANDVCDYCLSGASSSHLGPGSPEAFVAHIEEAVELVRQSIPRTIVNVVGLFTVSEIYNLTTKEPQCTPLSLPPIFPRLPLECSCAWAPGAIGDATRKKMDTLGEEYAEGLQEMVKRIRKRAIAEQGDKVDFGIVWQPGSFLPLGSFPTTTLSPTDCFHPSAQAHGRIATGLWNRLVLNGSEKRKPMAWDNEAFLERLGKQGRIRCMEETDRVHFD
ncbi:hypothetical protein NliqN6_3991 [Naganishia liquefaciens]|uniref:SGNH/GDSL hydrolase family protein n=1 Tax=Naganishia liquefaciens TaxID=104408 RepID=A0A8H3TWP4_9TREE|nr:hypothetical protein NliqN6_3991 [Naganishia liquefaciens]